MNDATMTGVSQTSVHQDQLGARAGEGRVALETLSIKRRTTSAKAAARSKLIRRLRIILPLMAAALVIALFQNMRSDTPDEAFLEDFTLDVTPEQLEMANPRFTGVDGSGKPFEIVADTAVRAPEEQEALSLSNPKAVTQGDDAKTVVVAREGLFQSEKKILQLDKDVTVEHTIGDGFYTLKTPAATVLIDDKIVQSDKGVVGDGPGGDELQADRMTAYQDEDRVVFEGNVRLKVYQTADRDGRSAFPSIRGAKPLTPEAAPGDKTNLDNAFGKDANIDDNRAAAEAAVNKNQERAAP